MNKKTLIKILKSDIAFPFYVVPTLFILSYLGLSSLILLFALFCFYKLIKNLVREHKRSKQRKNDPLFQKIIKDLDLHE